MAEDQTAQPKPEAATAPKPKPEGAAAAPAKAKPKEKKPKVEDKPFGEFIQQDYLPALSQAFTDAKIEDVALDFNDNQVTGTWLDGKRQFTVYFPQGSIQKQRRFRGRSMGAKQVPSSRFWWMSAELRWICWCLG